MLDMSYIIDMSTIVVGTRHSACLQERWAGTSRLWRRHQAVMFHQRKSRLARLIDYIDGVRTCCWLLVHSLYC